MGTRIAYGVLPVVTSLPVHVARSEGIFEKHGLNVELVDFKSATEKNRAFARRDVDAMESDTVTTILFAASGYNVKALTHYLVEFSLVAGPGRRLDNVRSIGVSMRTVTEWSAHDLLERELRLNLSLFTFIDIQAIPERLRSLLEGAVDAAILPEPWTTMALKRGGKLVAKKFTECCMDLFYEDVLTEEVGEKFVSAIREAVKRIRSDPARYLRMLREEATLPEEVEDPRVLTLFQREDYVRLSFPRDLFANIAEWVLRRGYSKTAPRYEEVFYLVRQHGTQV